MEIQLPVRFSNEGQKAFYFATERFQVFSGGFNNGKSYGGCLKALTLLLTFENYRYAIARQTYADLKKTTMQTFFKLCPEELIERHNEQDGLTILKNRSRVDWLHLDNVDESTLRGFEPNSILTDQAEETNEKVFDVLDARVGRWDDAVVPQYLLDANPNWPQNPITGKYIAPSYNQLLCNPDTQFHYIFRKFHPDSPERFKSGVFWVEGEWDPNLGSRESFEAALRHDEEWVNKYVKGQWGISEAQIHKVASSSLLEWSPELLDRIKRKGNLFRILDHGDASPTCCLWFAAIDGVYICFREYYLPNALVSDHRKNIAELSEGESYSADFADPSIFHKQSQKNAGFWTVADEYLTSDIKAPSITWVAADNNEFATRNRINELLRSDPSRLHPITKEPKAPGLYFIRKSEENPYGCFHSITQLQSQRRKVLGYVDGKAIYCDDRDDKVTDHAYDPTRYFVAMHGSSLSIPKREPPRNSIKWFKMMTQRAKARGLMPMSGSSLF